MVRFVEDKTAVILAVNIEQKKVRYSSSIKAKFSMCSDCSMRYSFISETMSFTRRGTLSGLFVIIRIVSSPATVPITFSHFA